MKKLKNKVFFTIFIILTFFLLSILFIFNYQDYQQEKRNINNNLKRMFENTKEDIFLQKEDLITSNNITPPKLNDQEYEESRKLFMDTIIYSVVLDANNAIVAITSHNEEGLDNDQIKTLALQIIKDNTNNAIHMGNLYFEKYSYLYKIGNYITIIDNTNTNARLQNSLKTSIVIFLLLELVIIAISNLLTKWIIKPVLDSFNKQKQFIADASHELKTPLSVIIASSESLENDISEKKWLYNIQSEAERMNKLISNLLYLATLEKETDKEYELHNLSKTIEMSVLTFESLIYEKNISLKYDITENINIKCDVDEIKQLVAILLDNAIKHSSKNGKIIINLKELKDEVILEVKNKGEAIPIGEEEKIFERFYRIDKARNRNENRYGLGLAIAKSIVINHNGKISANSTNGYTTFKVSFKKKN